MPAWAAFGALTLVLIAVLLFLSIVSASAVDASEPPGVRSSDAIADRTTALERSEGRDRMATAVGPEDPRLPRFEGDRAPSSIEEHRREPPGMSTGALLANVALTQGLFGAVLLVGVVYFEIPLTALGFVAALDPIRVVLAGLGVGLVLWLGNEVAAGLADAANVAYDEAVRSMLTPDSLGGWVLLLGLILPTIAFVEELLFRGAAIGAMAAGFDLPEPLLLVVSSLVFGGAHGAQGRVGAAVATALGFVLGGVFVLTGSLLVVVLAHYLVNALEFVIHEGLDVDRPLVVRPGAPPR